MKVLESDIQAAIIKFLEYKKAIVVKFNNVGIKKANGSYIPPRQKGISDLLVCYKGIFIAIEVKRPGNSTTVFQDIFLENIQKAGGYAIVASDVSDVEYFLKSLAGKQTNSRI